MHAKYAMICKQTHKFYVSECEEQRTIKGKA
jgi:hypothetical protein